MKKGWLRICEPVPVVWSALGPVPLLGVVESRDQLKSSVLDWTRVQKLSVKSHVRITSPIMTDAK